MSSGIIPFPMKPNGVVGGYMRLNYLESSGTQWLVTNIKPAQSMRALLKFETLSSVSTSYQWFFGGGRSASKAGCFALAVSQGSWYHEISGTNRTAGSVSANQVYDIDYSVTQFSVNGAVYSTYATTLSISNDYINIFRCVNGTNQYDAKPNCRIYNFTLTQDGQPVFNGIPALDPSGRPCMYDTVTKKPFYNQGTGEFKYA